MSFSRYIQKTLEQGQQHSAKKLTSKLRRTAYDSGWPTSASRHLKVVADNGSYNAVYPAQYAKEIEDVEYGTPDAPPNPTVRRFMASLPETEYTNFVVSKLRKDRVI